MGKRMGKTMGQGGGLTRPGPSRIAEAAVAVLLPPACREEVLGDLHERFKSPMQYAADACFTVPLVVVSRMRRTADPQVLLIQAFALYLSFLGAAWLRDRAILSETWSLLRLAIPAAIVMLGLILDDTYAAPGPRSSLQLARGPVLGVVMALASQEMLWIGKSGLALPRWIMFYGCAMSLLLSTAIRILFPPVSRQPLGANAPVLWLKQDGGSGANLGIVAVLKVIAAIFVLAILATWIAEGSVPPKAGMVMLLMVLLAAYRISKKG
jgi:hypothetical protein